MQKGRSPGDLLIQHFCHLFSENLRSWFLAYNISKLPLSQRNVFFPVKPLLCWVHLELLTRLSCPELCCLTQQFTRQTFMFLGNTWNFFFFFCWHSDFLIRSKAVCEERVDLWALDSITNQHRLLHVGLFPKMSNPRKSSELTFLF